MRSTVMSSLDASEAEHLPTSLLPERPDPVLSPRKRQNENTGEHSSNSKRPRRSNDFLKNLEETILHILARSKDNAPNYSDYMGLYSDVYNNLVGGSLHLKRQIDPSASSDCGKQGCTPDEIYRSLEKALKTKLKEIIQKGSDSSDLLSFYAEKFGLFKFHVTFIDGMFAYMNRSWVRTVNRSESETIYSFSMIQWRGQVFKEFRNQLADEFLQLIRLSRDDLGQRQELIKTIVDSYIIMSDPRVGSKSTPTTTAVLLNIYCESFETPFLIQCTDYYENMANIWTLAKPIDSYLQDIEEYLEKEKSICSAIFHETTIPKLTAAILNEFVREKSEFLLESIPGLINANDVISLKKTFDLFMRLENYSISKFIEVFKNDFVHHGLGAVVKFHTAAINKEIEGKLLPIHYVDTLVKVCQYYDRIISTCFNNHIEFRKAFDEAAMIFVNQNVCTKIGDEQFNFNKTPELLGRYSHAVLVTNSLIPQEETSDAINKLFLVLKYTESKDSFEKYYNWNLLSRLINKTSSSDDNEGSVIAQMKSNFGQDYSMKSHQLTQDARISDEISRNFKSSMHEKDHALPFDFHIAVFKNGSCKLPECPPINIPQEIAPVMNSFIEYYGKQYEGRTLTWYHNKSFGEIIYNAGLLMNKKYTFTVSVYQMTILLLFNERTAWTLEDIKESTLIEMNILTQVLPILERTKLLTKNSSCAYELFQNYKSNKHKHDINVPIKSELKTGSEEAVNDEVQNQRNFVLQAVMVRLMKANQTMRHSDLIAETIASVSNRFKPNVTRIKRTIDCLIEKEYLKRDDEESDRYVYIS